MFKSRKSVKPDQASNQNFGLKRILLIIPYGSVGGMERLAMHFYNYFKARGDQVKVLKMIQLPADIVNFDQDEIPLAKIDLDQMSKIRRLVFYLSFPLSIRRAVRQHRITHSIAFGDFANVSSSLSLSSEFKVASLHSLKSMELSNNSVLSRVFKLAYKTTYCLFNKVVCISQATKNDLLENCGYRFPENLAVIYNPHDIPAIEEASSLPINSEVERELFHNHSVVLFLGRLSNEKGLWHLVKSFSIASQADPQLKLVLLGDGSDRVREYLDELIQQLNIQESVFFLGRKSNPYPYIKQAKVLALSSYFEGTPNVIVEAIATETPVVTSNCTPALLELMSVLPPIRKDKMLITEAGVITPTFYKGSMGIPEINDFIAEEYEFANAIEWVVRNPEFQERLKANRQQLLEKFDLDSIASSYLQKL